MTLAAQFQQALAATPTFSSGDQVIRVDEGSRRLECHLTALEPLACAVLRLTLAADKLSNMNSAELQQVAQNLSGRLTYLLEPISPIETDAEGCVVQMRSNPPQKNEDRTSYYELLVARAGSEKADPLIRFVVDDENGDLAHKDESFAQKVMFWRKGQSKTTVATAAASGANAPVEVDAAAEEARLKKLVGTGGVVITREKKTGIKLPGL